MRQVITHHGDLFSPPIDKIEIDVNSRDEIPEILLGLRSIYSEPTSRGLVFDILHREIIDPVRNPHLGRHGMDLWNILVFGSLRLGCNCDYDKLKELGDQHRTVRAIVGLNIYDSAITFPLQTLKDNVSLLTEKLMDKINQVVVNLGHKALGKKPDEPLRGSADSSVVKTNIEYPTDIGILFDAVQGMVRFAMRLCDAADLTGWRKGKLHLREAKKLFRLAQQKKRGTKASAEAIINAHKAYIELVKMLINKIEGTISEVTPVDPQNSRVVGLIMEVNNNIYHAKRQIDQIYRRVVEGETIPHHEKVFSIFEEHTEWISKGKAGVPVELGKRICFIKDQFGFILHHIVMENVTDDKVAVPIVQEAKERFPLLDSCSFDKGFHSPENQKRLAEIINLVILPRKGRLSKAAKLIENSEDFREGRRKHSAVESTIGALQNHGLDKCPDHGLDGFKKYVALGVLARNLQILGHNVREQERKKRKRAEKRRHFRLAA